MNLHYANKYDDYIIIDLYKLLDNGNYNQVIECTSKYLEKFPNNQEIRIIRSEAYIKIFNYDCAIEDLKYNSFLGNNESLGRLYMLYYYLNNYSEALKLLPIIKQKKCIDNRSEIISEIIIKKSLGMIFSLKRSSNYKYIKSQIIHYNSQKTLEHIQHHVYSEGYSNKNTSFFNENINLRYLYSIIKKRLNKYNKACILDSMDIYYFYIKNLGYSVYDIYGIYDVLKVVVIPNTNKIITMFPINNSCAYDAVDLYLDDNKLFYNKSEKVKKYHK